MGQHVEIMNITNQLVDKLELKQVCNACPEDYEVFLNGIEVGYIRLRWGHFRVDCPFKNTIFTKNFKNNMKGGFDNETERSYFLSMAKLKILAELLKNKLI